MILDLPAFFIVFVALGVSRFVRVCGPVHRPYPGWQRQQLPLMPSGKFRSGQTGAAEVPSERKQETQEIESQHCKKNTKKRQNLPYRFKLMKETPCTKYNIYIYIATSLMHNVTRLPKSLNLSDFPALPERSFQPADASVMSKMYPRLYIKQY